MYLVCSSGISVSVVASLLADGEEVIYLPAVKEFGLLNTVKEMMDSGTYALGATVFVFSGIWPYTKVFMMLFCWLAPVSRLKPSKRFFLLNFLDFAGKWSLVDSFVMVLFMVAFGFELPAAGTPILEDIFAAAEGTGEFRIYVEPGLGFYMFLIATISSFVLGHLMTYAHRYAYKVGECGRHEEYGVGRESRRRLYEVLRPADRLKGKIFAHGPWISLGVSIALVMVGTFMDTFAFTFEGIAGFVLGEEGAVRPFSVMKLGLSVPDSNPWPNSIGIRSVQVCFMLFVIFIVLVYLALMIVLWTAPLTNKVQRRLFVAVQVMNAWSGLDVFVLSILASVLQIRQFALSIVGDKCDALNSLVEKTAIAPMIPGYPPVVCFDLHSDLREGFFLLAAAAVIADVTGAVVLSRCEAALCSAAEA